MLLAEQRSHDARLAANAAADTADRMGPLADGVN